MAFDLYKSVYQRFMDRCHKQHIKIDINFAQTYIYILFYDTRLGLSNKLKQINECKIQQFLDLAVEKYMNPLDVTMCNMKLTNFFENCKTINSDFFQKIFHTDYENKLQNIINYILQYPETCNDEQIKRMCNMMLVFIITNYCIGSPKDHVLLQLTQQSLNSILGKNELQNYVWKKKIQRFEYLKRICATAAGILIYNNHESNIDSGHIRDLFGEIDSVKLKTKHDLETGLIHIMQRKLLGSNVIESAIQIDIKNKKVNCLYPIEKVREINKFVALYSVYENLIIKLIAIFKKTEFIVGTTKDKFLCSVNRIRDILKFRTAVESEAIFPHFVYLSEVWNLLNIHYTHLCEFSKIKDCMNDIVTNELENKLLEMAEQINSCVNKVKNCKSPTFNEIIEQVTKRDISCYTDVDYHEGMHEYCALTIAYTDGLLIKAGIKKNLCIDKKKFYGFRNHEFAKYAERNLENFFHMFRTAIFSTIDSIYLFDMQKNIFLHITKSNKKEEDTIHHYETQTEMVVKNDLSVPNRINVAWNSWDFHRETIRLANIRKRQTNSAQTVLSYGQRNATNQTYNARSHINF